MASVRADLLQRADYTQKFNARSGRHGWLRLTPAYSLKVVEELVTGHPRTLRVFDPFCGTATTALSAAYHGHEAVTTDINPFLVWLGRAKTAIYLAEVLDNTHNACARVLDLVRSGRVEPCPLPPLHKIERWWSEEALRFLRLLRAAIDEVISSPGAVKDLLLVAFCRTLIGLSNAAFNHQSMSFKDPGQTRLALGEDLGGKYAADLEFVLAGAKQNPHTASSVILADARNASSSLSGPFDRVITSPPYANRMSYIRELRPYMYWLGYLVGGRDAGELDWSAIGGTWGVATSRLVDWRRGNKRLLNESLDQILSKVAHDDNKNGRLLSNYIAKYFDDIWLHLQDIGKVLAAGAEVHYIVGNSTFYGVLLPVEQIYAAMLSALGYENVNCTPLRKRNSKKELIEFDVSAAYRSG